MVVLQEESGIGHVADPWAGSFFMERLTAEMEARAQALVEEVEAMGGMTHALVGGLPKVCSCKGARV